MKIGDSELLFCEYTVMKFLLKETTPSFFLYFFFFFFDNKEDAKNERMKSLNLMLQFCVTEAIIKHP